MSRVVTLDGLKVKSRLDGSSACTPVSMEDKDGNSVVVCKESIAESLPKVQVTQRYCKRRGKDGRCLGRPRNSSSRNPNYRTKKGARVKPTRVTSCPVDQREWVTVKTGGGKRGKRCRCTAPGNSRFLKNSECV